jgi:hypothetical protein
MYWALLKDGRQVVVNTARKTERKVTSPEGITHQEQVGNQHRQVWLEHGWQTVHSSNLKPLEPTNPFNVLNQ